MSDAKWEKGLLAKVNNRGDILAGDDGYLIYWPSGGGALSAAMLRVIADELDRRNKPWDDIIANDPAVSNVQS